MSNIQYVPMICIMQILRVYPIMETVGTNQIDNPYGLILVEPMRLIKMAGTNILALFFCVITPVVIVILLIKKYNNSSLITNNQ